MLKIIITILRKKVFDQYHCRQDRLFDKNAFYQKDIRQKMIRQLVLFRLKIRPDHIRRVVIVPLSRLSIEKVQMRFCVPVVLLRDIRR